ncbi:hypothetical protein Tco_1394761, partial [Tanacetum coccineum]
RAATEVNNTIMVRDQFLEELDSLGVRHVPSKLAEFLREIQMRDKETVAKLQVLVAEMELNAHKKDKFIQKLKGLMPYRRCCSNFALSALCCYVFLFRSSIV